MQRQRTLSGSVVRLLAVATAAAMLVVASSAASPPGRSDQPSGQAPWAAQLAAAQAAADRECGPAQAPIAAADSTACHQARAQIWTTLEGSASQLLHERPSATDREIESGLDALGRDDYTIDASAVHLTARPPTVAVAINADFRGGTFFVVSLDDPAATTTWSVQPAAEAALSAGHEALSGWAYPAAGFHNGPLAGRVVALPPTRMGRPRFLVQAAAQALAGLEVPAEVSVWEWTGSEAIAEFFGRYITTDLRLATTLHGDTLRFPTKETPTIFYSCGSCDEPQGIWTLRITKDGVKDLGHASREPLLDTADKLVARVLHHQEASALARASAVAHLGHYTDALHEQAVADHQEQDLEAGVRGLSTWRVLPAAHGLQSLEIESDAMGQIVFHFTRRGGAPYVTAIDLPQE